MKPIRCVMVALGVAIALPDAHGLAPQTRPSQAAVPGSKFPWLETGAPVTTTAPAGVINGAIAIRLLQGTPGGPAIGVVPVRVELRHRGSVVRVIDTQSDEHGIVMLENLPVSMGIQPVVRAQYADLFYQVEAGLMDAEHSQQQIDVVCYEPTETPPQWKVQMRHVMIAPAPEGLAVTEVLVVENPEGRTWIGLPIGGRRVTTSFVLPAGARNLALGAGFHDWTTSSISGNRLVNHLPLMPEATRLVYSYLLPARSGSVSIDLEAPAAVDHMMVLAPESMQPASVSGLEAGGVEDMGGSKVRIYLASNIRAGDKAAVSFTGLVAEASTAPGKAGGTRMFQIVAALGGGILLLIAIGLIVRRPRTVSPAASGAAKVHS
jgi:hypothetical protein